MIGLAILALFAVMGLGIVVFVLSAFVVGVYKGFGDAWRYWAVRRRYKLK